MLGSIAAGTTSISNFATSADCASTMGCFRSLGVNIEQIGTNVTIEGAGKHGLQKPRAALDCGNSGTTMRLMSGILAGQRFDSILTGDESLHAAAPAEDIELFPAKSRDNLVSAASAPA